MTYDPESRWHEDREVMRLVAHVDQTRSKLRETLRGMSTEEVVQLIKTCAAGELAQFDARHSLLVGLLAVVAILDLRGWRGDAGEQPG